MIVLTAATGQEINAISKCFTSKKRISDKSRCIWNNKFQDTEILTVQTGINRSGVENILESVLTTYGVSAVVSFGFGGALNRDLHTGDLIVCTGVVLGENKGDSKTDRFPADERLVRHAVNAMQKSNLKWLRGESITLSRLALDKEEKLRLGETTGTCVCEMEDYWVARSAYTCRVPFISVRVIYDTLEDRIPNYDRLVDLQGNVTFGRTVKYLVSSPEQILGGWSSYRNSVSAKRSLSIFTERFLNNLIRAEVES